MAKKVVGYIKLQIPAGKATPQPPIGPALGQHGVAIPVFYKRIQRAHEETIWVMIIPVVITVYADHSFSFITKTPPAAVLIKKALRDLESALRSCRTRTRSRQITTEQVETDRREPKCPI